MTFHIQTQDIALDGVSHRWTPARGTCQAYGTIQFGPVGRDVTVFLHEPAEIDEVIAELVALRAEMSNAPHHATEWERPCRAWDNKSAGYICTAQDGHSGPDHIAYMPGGGEYRRWPAAPGTGGVLFPAAGEDEDGPMDDEAELRRADEIRAEPVCQWHGGEGPSGGQCGACLDEAAVGQADSRLLDETVTTAAGAA